MRPTASVIVPFAGSAAELAQVVELLGTIDLETGDEIIVADNRPAAAAGERRAGAVTILGAAGPRTPYHARNVAAARAQGEWLVFIDADTVPAADLLESYLSPTPPDAVGILAGTVTDRVGRDTRVARYVVARGKMDQDVTLSNPFGPYAQTANAAIRRSAFESVGGFVPDIRSGGDADICWRLQAAGWALEPRPAARVEHTSRTSLGALMRQLARHGAGARWLERVHPGAAPARGPLSLARGTAAALRDAAQARRSGDRDEAGFRLLDLAGDLAFGVGRLRSNRAR
jgi:cellulose synthase/poly-beta-1,6-N-acetylglucosamine synthase-like glycosyltransferase